MAPTIEQFRAACKSQDGVAEIPDNDVFYNTWYYGHRVNGSQYPWCAVFMSWIWIVACRADLSAYGFGARGSAGVWEWRTRFQNSGRWGHTAKVGAMVCFGNDGHIGWVDEITIDGFWYWSGNTGQGSYNNGGGVHRAFVSFANPPEPIEGYCYPDYAPEEDAVKHEPFIVVCRDPKHSTAQYLVLGSHVIPVPNQAEGQVLADDQLDVVPLGSIVFDAVVAYVGK